jgi:hypothetical protein
MAAVIPKAIGTLMGLFNQPIRTGMTTRKAWLLARKTGKSLQGAITRAFKETSGVNDSLYI